MTFDPSKEPNITCLRYNRGMIRDCWWEQDENNEKVFVIRQLNIQEPLKTKQIRLLLPEVKQLLSVIQSELNK